MEERIVILLKAAYEAAYKHYVEGELSASECVGQTLLNSQVVISPASENELIQYLINN